MRGPTEAEGLQAEDEAGIPGGVEVPLAQQLHPVPVTACDLLWHEVCSSFEPKAGRDRLERTAGTGKLESSVGMDQLESRGGGAEMEPSVRRWLVGSGHGKRRQKRVLALGFEAVVCQGPGLGDG